MLQRLYATAVHLWKMGRLPTPTRLRQLHNIDLDRLYVPQRCQYILVVRADLELFIYC